MKTLRKKLFLSILAVAFAVVSLATSTFAWFSINNTVTASEMTVKATTDANLYIAKGASVVLDSITETKVEDLGVSALTLSPADLTATTGTVTVRFASEYSTAPTVGTSGAASEYTNVGTITQTTVTNTPGTVANYVAVGFVSIARKQTAPATFDLTPTCTVTVNNAEHNLAGALRAGVIINNVYYESDDAAVDGTTVTLSFTSNPTSLDDNTAYSMALLIWYEGDDADCYVNNAVNLANCTASWSFKGTTHA